MKPAFNDGESLYYKYIGHCTNGTMSIPAGGGHVHLLLLGSGGPLWPLVLLFLVSMYRCACYFFVLLAAGGPLSLGKKTAVRTQHLTPTVTP
jgi:hypothetical protein